MGDRKQPTPVPDGAVKPPPPPAPPPRIWHVEQGINDFDIVERRNGRAPYRLAGYIERQEDADVIAACLVMLQALREVAGDHVAILPGDQIPTCAFCSADEGSDHEAECTMNVVLAAIDLAEGREPKACYVVSDRPVRPISASQYLSDGAPE
jgi:hypothetical protein